MGMLDRHRGKPLCLASARARGGFCVFHKHSPMTPADWITIFLFFGVLAIANEVRKLHETVKTWHLDWSAAEEDKKPPVHDE